jgi:fluoroacetyl-CoA thioesterase
MRPNILNAQFTLSICITEEMTAILDNKQIHPVYSTFWLVYHAELASRKAIEPYFETDDQAIGAGISIQHISMASIGETVEITAIIKEYNGSKILSEFIAVIPKHNIIIAKGEQTQILMKQADIDKRISLAYSRSH